jgi:hypothetical protein
MMMNGRKAGIAVFGALVAGLVLMGCTLPSGSGPCTFTANMDVNAYRLPDGTSAIFGTISAGETFEALARTSDGWLGFDPGIAQAGNIGLAHHRWVQANLSLSSSCLSSVDLVTLADVEADVAASGG